MLEDHRGISENYGARFDPQARAGLAIPPLVFTTTVEFHSARVEKDLLLFKPTMLGITPAGPGRNADLVARPPSKRKARFFAPAAEVADDLEVRRDRDRLLLFRDPQPQGSSLGLGLAMFGATTVLSAHAPAPFRAVFDGPVHLGPAVFDGGGMGAGVAGRGL